jgi:hypothetical protein
MPDATVIKLAAAAPLAVGGILLLFNPLYDKLIERGAERTFSNNRYLSDNGSHTPIYLIIQYTSWALDIVQAGPLIIGPLAGLVAALGIGTIKNSITWIYLAFVIVGLAIFLSVLVIKEPVLYGQKKMGLNRHGQLFLGWTRVSLAAIFLYGAAAVVAAVLA